LQIAPLPSADCCVPSPQQYLPDGGPFDLPPQSLQLLQFSPGSQMPSPSQAGGGGGGGAAQNGSAEQSLSAQSATRSQSLSMVSLHVPLTASNPGGRPQSIPQLQELSFPAEQEPSPQQNAGTELLLHAKPFVVQRASAQPTGFCPAPSPQQ
jgi:hypothetical protein